MDIHNECFASTKKGGRRKTVSKVEFQNHLDY